MPDKNNVPSPEDILGNNIPSPEDVLGKPKKKDSTSQENQSDSNSKQGQKSTSSDTEVRQEDWGSGSSTGGTDWTGDVFGTKKMSEMQNTEGQYGMVDEKDLANVDYYGGELKEVVVKPQKKKEDEGSVLGDIYNRFGRGAIAAYKGVMIDLPNMAEKGLYAATNWTLEQLGSDTRVKINEYDLNHIMNMSVGNKMDEVMSDLDKSHEEYNNSLGGGGITDAYEKGDYSTMLKRIASTTAESAPMALAAILTGGESLGTNLLIFGSSAGQKYDEINKKNKDLSEGTKFAVSVANGGLEVIVGKFMEGVSGTVWKQMLSDLGEEGAKQVAKNSFKDWMVKTVGDSPAVAIGVNMLEEGLTDLGQQGVDIAGGLQKEINWQQNSDARWASTGFGIPSAAITYGVKGYVSHKTNQRVNDNNKKITNLQNKIADPNMSEASKNVIKKTIDGIYNDNKKILGADLNKFNAISDSDKKLVVDLDKKIDDLRSEAVEVKYDPNLNDEEKATILTQLGNEAKTATRQREDILSQDVSVDVDVNALPLKEQDTAKKKALDELTTELNPDGSKDITITNEMVIARANKNIKEEKAASEYDSRIVTKQPETTVQGGELDGITIKPEATTAKETTVQGGELEGVTIKPEAKTTEDVTITPKEYVDELNKTKESDPETFWSVDAVTEQAASDGTIINTNDGSALVSKDGDIKGVFKKLESKAKGVAQDLISKAVAAGGIKLDNFDGYLTKLYEKAGFRVVSRLPFNEEYAPDGWNKEKHGTPDVVIMIYDPKGNLDIEEKNFTDYDEAMAYRDSYVDQAKENNNTPKTISTEKLKQQVKSAETALSKILPNTKVVLHPDADSYHKAIGENDNSAGTFMDNTIHINPEQANERTVPHEVAHAIVLGILKSDPEAQRVTREMMKSLNKVIPADLKAKLQKFLDDGEYDKALWDEESIAELTGYLANNFDSLTPQAKNIVIQWIQQIQKMAGLRTFTDKEVIDFMKTMATKVATGDVLTAEDVSMLGISGDINSLKLKPKKSIIGDIKLNRFPVNENTTLRENVPLSKFNGKKSNIIESDRMTGAYVSDEKGNPIYRFFGGIYYPVITGKWWASSNESTANKIVKNANKNRDKDGYIYTSPIILESNSHMSNQDMFEAVWEFMKHDLRNKNNKVTKTKFTELLNKAFSTKVFAGEKIVDINPSDNIETIIKKIDDVIKGSKFTFVQRRAFLKSILGDPKVGTNRNFPSAGSFSEVAMKFAEPETSKSGVHDVVMVMRTKGTLSAVESDVNDPNYHKSYPWEIKSNAPVEVFMLDGAYPIGETFPELTKSSGDKFTWKEYYDKHSVKSDETAVAQYGRTAKLSFASGNITTKPIKINPETVTNTNPSRKQFVGKKANLSEQQKLDRENAIKMLSEGVDPKKVKQETGWEVGADGDMRYEIDSSKAKVNPDWLDTPDKGRKVKDVFDFPELFEMYPKIGNLPLVLSNLGPDVNGSFSEGKVKLNYNLSTAKLLSVFLHEIQHFIQRTEGWSGGANQGIADVVRRAVRNIKVKPIKRILDFFENTLGIKPSVYIAEGGKEGLVTLWDKNRKELADNVAKVTDVPIDKIEKVYIDFTEGMGVLPANTPRGFAFVPQAAVQLVSKYKMTPDQAIQVNEYMNQAAYDLYQRVVGETEARNVQGRQDMTAEERRSTLASETETIERLIEEDGVITPKKVPLPRTEQIVKRGSGPLLSQNAPRKQTGSQPTPIDKISDKSEKAIRDRQSKPSISGVSNFIRKNVLDRQTHIKKLINGISNSHAKKAFDRLVTKAGASALASERFKKAQKDIFGGLNTEDKKLLNGIIYARRIVSINESRGAKGEKAYVGMDGYTNEFAQSELDRLKSEIGDKKFNELNERAGKYFNVFNENLRKLYDSGRITRDQYFHFRDIEYSPIKTIKYIIGDNINANDIDRQAMATGMRGADIKKLSDLNENDIILDAEWLLAMNTATVEARAFENNMLREFNSAIENATPEEKAAMSEFVVENPKKTKKYKIKYGDTLSSIASKNNTSVSDIMAANPQITDPNKIKAGADIVIPKEGREYDDKPAPEGFEKVSFFDNGNKTDIIIKPDLAKQLLDIKEKNTALENIGKLSGTSILRFFATGGNPLFIVGNTAVDFQNIAFFSDTYSKFKPLATAQLARDFTKNFIKKAVMNDTYNNSYQEYVEHGGGMEYMANDGLVALKSMNPASKIAKATQKGFLAYGRAMAFLGETSEVAFRVSVFDRVKKTETEKFVKENGRQPNSKEADDIMWTAAREARETMDFSQGGTYAKQVDAVFPYFNAALQGFRRPLDFAYKNKMAFGSSVIQYTMMTGTLAAGSLALLIKGIRDDNDDDDEANKEIARALSSISTYEKANYHIMFTGNKNEDGEYEYYRIKKLPVLSVVSTIAEQHMYKKFFESKGIPYKIDTESILDAVEKSSPLPISAPELFGRNPLISGLATYYFNKDTFTGEEVFRGNPDEKILPEVEGMYDDKVEQVYKDLAPKLGLSPIRTKAFVEKIITSENTNPTIPVIYSAYDGIFNNENGLGNEVSEAVSNVGTAFGKKVRRFTNRKVIAYKEQDDMEYDEMIINTDKYKIEQSIYNTIKETYKRGDSITKADIKAMMKEKFDDPNEQVKYGKKYYTYIKNMSVDRGVLDIIYEDDADVLAMKLNRRYGNSLDDTEKAKLEEAYKNAGRNVNKKAYDIYKSKYKDR